MKRILLIFFSTYSFTIQAQSDSATLVPVIRNAANSMMTSFKNKDYIGFTRFNNPGLVLQMGGEVQFAAYIEKEMNALNGVLFNEMKAGSVLRLITNVNPMQSIVEQYSELMIDGHPLSSVSHLVGISSDSGKTWYFTDANTASPEEIKNIIPELSHTFYIPRKKQVHGITLASLLKDYKIEY